MTTKDTFRNWKWTLVTHPRAAKVTTIREISTLTVRVSMEWDGNGVSRNKLQSGPGLTLSTWLEKDSLWRPETTGPGQTRVTAMSGWFSTRNASNQPCSGSGKHYLVIIYDRTLSIIGLLWRGTGAHCGLMTLIWHRSPWPTLVQVKACCLTAPSPNLNQCGLVTNEVLWHSFQGNVY